MVSVLLSLGSNLGDRLACMHRAVDGMRGFLKIHQLSTVYETSPVGDPRQPLFLNMAIRGASDLRPRALLDHLLDLEIQLGRVRTVPGGPRSIDIDLVFYGDTILDTPDITLPHPRYHRRRFVLTPACDVAADWVCPVRKKNLRTLLLELDTGELVFPFASPPSILHEYLR